MRPGRARSGRRGRGTGRCCRRRCCSPGPAASGRSPAVRSSRRSPHRPGQELRPDGGLALSPDGARLAFVATDRTARLRSGSARLDSSAPAGSMGPKAASGPFWSPDGASLGYFAGGQLRVMDLRSGTRRALCPRAAARRRHLDPERTDRLLPRLSQRSAVQGVRPPAAPAPQLTRFRRRRIGASPAHRASLMAGRSSSAAAGPAAPASSRSISPAAASPRSGAGRRAQFVAPTGCSSGRTG